MDEQQDSNQQAPSAPPENLPGATFKPGQTFTPGSQPEQPLEVQQPPVEIQPQPLSQPQTPTSPQPSPEPLVEVSTPEQAQPINLDDPNAIVWEASEHINYGNGGGWMALMVLGGVLLAALIWYLVDIMSAIVVILLMGGMIFYSRRKPQVVRYSVSTQGISIGGNIYNYSEFRSFSFNENGGLSSIYLVPLQRFMIPITMYVDPNSQHQVADVLSQYLPNKQRQPDFMDRLTAKLRL